jgi:hypothetical protein
MVLLHTSRPVQLRQYFRTHSPTFTSHLHLAVHPTLRTDGPASDRRRLGDPPAPRHLLRAEHAFATHLGAPSAPRAAHLGTSGSTRPRHVQRAGPAIVPRRAVGLHPAMAPTAAPTVARIGRSHQRVELAAPARSVLRAPQILGNPFDGTPGPDDGAARHDAMAGPLGRSGTAAIPAPVAIDLDQLTDDVVARLDSRLTAQRERLGRAF